MTEADDTDPVVVTFPGPLTAPSEDGKAPGAFRTISEVSALIDVPQHVLRFWESQFSGLHPAKMKGGRRYYRPDDIALLLRIKDLLYVRGYTIKGARLALKDKAAPLDKERLCFAACHVVGIGIASDGEQLRRGALQILQSGLPSLPPDTRQSLLRVREDLAELRSSLLQAAGN